jgi:hypothetical protein
MDNLLRPFAPLLTLSTRAPLLLRPSTLVRIARDARLDGLDLDLTRRPFASASDAVAAAARADLPVRTVWLPTRPRWPAGSGERGKEASAARAGAAAMVVFGLPRGADGRPTQGAIVGTSESIRPLVSPATRLCVAIGPPSLQGGRAHLVKLTALRRLAEEWDFGIALDLAGPIDPRWEAEAAIARLGARLSLLRLDAEVAAGLAYGRARPASRALSAAIDGGYPTEFAIVARPSVWSWRWDRALTEACLLAGRRIRTRYAAVEEERTADAFPPATREHRGQQSA